MKVEYNEVYGRQRSVVEIEVGQEREKDQRWMLLLRKKKKLLGGNLGRIYTQTRR